MSYILRNADFVQTPLRNAVLDKRPSDPEHAVEGQVIFNTTDKKARIFKNGVWSEFTEIAEFASHLAEDVTQGNPHGINSKADKSLGTIFSATLQNGWTGTLNYIKNGVGIDTIVGYIVPGTLANDAVVATLPQGFRPIIMSHPFIVINTVTQGLEVGLSVSSSSGEVKLGKAFTNVAIAIHTTFQATED